MPAIKIVLEALTPIAHFDTRTGIDNATNRRLAMRAPRLVDDRTVYLPDKSANALRSAVLRAPLGNHLIETLGIAGQVPRGILNLLFSGGAMTSGARAPGDETAIGHAVYGLYPSLALLGGAVDAMILPRSKAKVTTWLVAAENRPALEAIFPEEAARATARLRDLVGEEDRIRGTSAESEGTQMIYGYEVLSAGTRIAVEIVLDRWASEATVSAVARALAEWDGFVGGQGRQGRGRCHVAWSDGLPSPDAYDAHVAANVEAMREGLVSGTLGAAKALCAA